MVAMCLVKDQTKRPTAEKLLKHSCFKNAKPPELSVKKLFADLPPLWDRVKALQLKDAAQLALKKMPSAEEEALSQSEYKRGVSGWNFDIEDLKAQASLLQDDDEMSEIREADESVKSGNSNKEASDYGSSSDKLEPTDSSNCRGQLCRDEIRRAEVVSNKGKSVEIASCKYGNREKNVQLKYGSGIESALVTSEREVGQPKTKSVSTRGRQTLSGPLMPGVVLSQSSLDKSHIVERSEQEGRLTTGKNTCDIRKAPSFSGPLMLPNRASANSLSAPIKSSAGYKDSPEDKSKANLVQIKGRFSVTSENVDLVKDIPSCAVPRRTTQGSPLRKSASVGDWICDPKQMPAIQLSKDVCNSFVATSFLLPYLQNLFQQTSIQQDLVSSLLTNLQPAEVHDASQNGKLPPIPIYRSADNGNTDTESSDKERLLLTKISELHARMDSLSEELNAERQKYQWLQQQLNAVSGGEGTD